MVLHDSFFIYINHDSNCMILLGQYIFKFCLISAGPSDACIINVGMNLGKVKPRRHFVDNI